MKITKIKDYQVVLLFFFKEFNIYSKREIKINN